MSNNTFKLVSSSRPEFDADPLSALLRDGARELIKQAVESELASLLTEHKDYKLDEGRQGLVRNGYLPKRKIQTGVGDVDVQVPKVRDRGSKGITFNSTLIPPYLRRSKSIEELIPWLYLPRKLCAKLVVILPF